MGGREHSLFGVVRECLANNPERRPNTSDLLSSLEEVGTETEGGLFQLDIARVKTARTLRAKERRIQVLQVRIKNKMFCVLRRYKKKRKEISIHTSYYMPGSGKSCQC